jgi:protocatechuate 3,4-dioxygenase beta subunit
VLAALGPLAAAAQNITGRVVDQATGLGVAAGFVVLLDGADAEVSRVLTAADGTFRFPQVTPGVYRLKSERIAYRAAYSASFELRPGESQRFQLEIEALPLRLASIEVREETRCRVRPSEGEATAILWEEIRKALAAATWTATQPGYRYRHVQYQRDLDRGGSQITEEQSQETTGYYRAPYMSRDAEELAKRGFVFEEGGDIWFFAPDEQVLQKDAFLSTHCFRVVRDPDEAPGRIGLSFEPTPGRSVADIEGVLWLDERTSELQALEFQYDRLPNDVEDERVGGTVEFLQLPNGAWVVYRWEIRMPILGVRRVPNRFGGPTQEVVVRGYRDAGGEVVNVETAAGETVFNADVARVSGVVTDHHAGRPLAGARVSLVGTDRSTLTDGSGRFVLTGFFDGEYALGFGHPRLDSMGFEPEPVPVTLRRGETRFIELEVPAPRAILQAVCPQVEGEDVRAIVGQVFASENGAPLAGALLLATWQAGFAGESINELLARGARIRGQVAEMVTDEEGRYQLCGVPLESNIALQAKAEERLSDPVTVTFDEDGVWYNRDVCLKGSFGDLSRGQGAENPEQRAACFARRELWPTIDLVWRQDFVIGEADSVRREQGAGSREQGAVVKLGWVR